MKTRNALIGLGVAAALAAGVGAYSFTASAQGGPGLRPAHDGRLRTRLRPRLWPEARIWPRLRHMRGYGKAKARPRLPHARLGRRIRSWHDAGIWTWLRPQNDGLVARSAAAPFNVIPIRSSRNRHTRRTKMRARTLIGLGLAAALAAGVGAYSYRAGRRKAARAMVAGWMMGGGYGPGYGPHGRLAWADPERDRGIVRPSVRHRQDLGPPTGSAKATARVTTCVVGAAATAPA